MIPKYQNNCHFGFVGSYPRLALTIYFEYVTETSFVIFTIRLVIPLLDLWKPRNAEGSIKHLYI